MLEPFVMQGGQAGRDIAVWRPVIENPGRDELARAAAAFVRASRASLSRERRQCSTWNIRRPASLR